MIESGLNVKSDISIIYLIRFTNECLTIQFMISKSYSSMRLMMKDRTPKVDAAACCVGTTTYGIVLGCLAAGCVPAIAGGIVDCLVTTVTCDTIPLMHTDTGTNTTTCVISETLGNVAGCAG